MAETTQTQGTQEVKEKLVLQVKNAPAFDSLIQTAYTSSIEFCDEFINPVFRLIFADFYGSKIEVGANRMLITTLAFSESNIDDGRAHAVTRMFGKDAKNDVDARIQMINKTIGSSRYQNQFKLTQDAKDLLEDIIPTGARQSNGSINWGAISGEGAVTNTFNWINQPQPIIQVQIDINRLVKCIYAENDKESGDSFQYMVTLGGPINPVSGLNGQMIVKNWQLFILRLSNKTVEDIARTYGVTGQNNMGFIC